jgi:hypothetical protein
MRIRIRIANMSPDPAGYGKAKPIWNRIRDTVYESDLKCQMLTKKLKILKTYVKKKKISGDAVIES